MLNRQVDMTYTSVTRYRHLIETRNDPHMPTLIRGSCPVQRRARAKVSFAWGSHACTHHFPKLASLGWLENAAFKTSNLNLNEMLSASHDLAHSLSQRQER